MTTVAQGQFSTMEPPPGDDSMEMASPYQGHMDDFEIDLDVMEDQVSEVDQDLDVADATPEPTNGPGSVNDADMVDEIDERPMIDADENNQGTVGQNENNGYYQTEETYEAQMEEYDEDIDAPVPEQPDIVITDTQPDQQDLQETSEFPEHQETTEPNKENKDEAHRDTTEHLTEQKVEQHDLQEQPKEAEGHGTEEAPEELDNVNDHGEQQHHQPEDDTNNSTRLESHEPHPKGVDNEQQAQDGEPKITQIHETPPSPEKDGAARMEEKGAHETVDEKTEESLEVSHLHPVKVLYQDTEISLFRPREGDSSETFFLEDESLAYGDLGKLLSSCREVLGEHISEGEVLVVDIDSLNLQLNEDSYHTSKVTLSQIVGLYLDLCRNDGMNEPEPLYLTLSTKPTLPAEISNLLAAAGEGKGLSHICQWEEYEDEQQIEDKDSPVGGEEEEEEEGQGRPESSEHVASVEAPEPRETEEEHVDRQPAPEEIDVQETTASNDREDTNADETESKPVDTTDEFSYERNDEIAPAVTDGHHEQQQDEEGELDGEPNEEAEPGEAGLGDEQYDYEEEASESTATLAQVSADELKVDKAAEESAAQGDRDAADAGEEATDSVDHNVAGDEVQDEDEEFDDGAYEHDGPPPGQYASLDVSQDGQQEQPTADPNELSEPKKVDAIPEQPLEVAEGDYGESDEQAEVHLESSDDTQHQGEEPGTNEDLLGIDEDIFKSPAKKANVARAPVSHDDSEHNTHASVLGAGQETSIHDTGDEYEELPFGDEDDYIDLGTASAFDGEIENGKPESRESGHSGKRSRSPEDEVDLAQSPSPDAKRRRSS